MDNNTYTSASDFDIRLTPQYRQAAMTGKFNQALPMVNDPGYADAVNGIHPGVHAQVMTDMYNNPTTMTALDDNTRQQLNMFMHQQNQASNQYEQARQAQMQQKQAINPTFVQNLLQQQPVSPLGNVGMQLAQSALNII